MVEIRSTTTHQAVSAVDASTRQVPQPHTPGLGLLCATGTPHQAGAQPDEQPSATNLIQVLRRHATERPNKSAFISLHDGHSEGRAMTYVQLDRRARAVAVHLQDMGLAGQRVLLAYPHGLDFVAGFFGCLYAGCTAVPTYLPHRRTLERFQAITDDADAHHVLGTSVSAAQYQAMARACNGQAGEAASVPWLATDEIPDALAERWKVPDIAPETLAMLQYTSGSTSQPKGVMLSHGNLIDNAHAIYQAFGLGRDTAVFWLPTYHDMGLVGGILEPILGAVTTVLIAPAAFLQRPIVWLNAISKFRASISGGPNFAYDLCARKVTDEQRSTLDLSCWSLAFIGAEPIHPETLERFAHAFAPCGFNPSAFYPCYGMAEATLMVSGAQRGSGPNVRGFDETALSQHRIEPVSDDAPKARRLVSCGSPVGDLHVVIADPTTSAPVPPDRIGEIWVTGASVGQGYWQKPAHTRHTFHAHLNQGYAGAGGDTGDVHNGLCGEAFLRTGDLGFVAEGQLYVIGRQDDLIIVRGLNHHPQDIEASARKSHPLLAAGFGAAFAVADSAEDRTTGQRQRLVLVHEAASNGQTDFVPVLKAARTAVLDELGLALHTVVLVRTGTIPKTSSGKVQRHACRTLFVAGQLNVLAEHHLVFDAGTDATVSTPASSQVGGTAGSSARETMPTASFVLATICQHALALGGTTLRDVTPDTPLAALGLDSLQRVELVVTLEKSFACALPDTEFNPAQTLGELAHAIHKHLHGNSRPGIPTNAIPPAHYDFLRFPEYGELKRYERMLHAVAGTNPYFRVDQGGTFSGSIVHIDGHDLISFSTYDYIGMAHDPDVAAAAKSAIDHYGTSAGASRLVCGEKQVHRDLEHGLAEFLGTPASIVFVSGHATNVTTLGHLLGPEDLVVHDALAHNSIMQGAQLSGATRRVFAHNDWRAMDALLCEVRHRYRRVLIAIEGVYSMDGDYPELPRFIEMKKKHKALMFVDEAHSLGTMGRTGRGIGEHWGVARADVDLWMGTLSKALASCGGYIAGSAALIEYLSYTAPGFVYSVGLSPPNAASALAALSLLRAEPQRVSRLRQLSTLFLKLAKARGLNTGSSEGTPVVPVIVGSSVKSLRLAHALFDRGINVQPILPPAVAEHSARLRFFITTNHSEQQIRDTVEAVADELAGL